MNRYSKGRRAEYKSIEYLKAKGYRYVARTAGSKGLADLIAFKEGQILLVQVKSGARRPSQEEIKIYVKGAEKLGCEHVWIDIHYWRPRAKTPDLIYCGRTTECLEEKKCPNE